MGVDVDVTPRNGLALEQKSDVALGSCTRQPIRGEKAATCQFKANESEAPPSARLDGARVLSCADGVAAFCGDLESAPCTWGDEKVRQPVRAFQSICGRFGDVVLPDLPVVKDDNDDRTQIALHEILEKILGDK